MNKPPKIIFKDFNKIKFDFIFCVIEDSDLNENDIVYIANDESICRAKVAKFDAKTNLATLYLYPNIICIADSSHLIATSLADYSEVVILDKYENYALVTAFDAKPLFQFVDIESLSFKENL